MAMFGRDIMALLKGEDGSALQIRVSDGYIQWKLETDTEWNNVIAVDDLKGADGVTPHIGEDGYWYIGDTSTGVKAQGEDGKDGNALQMRNSGGYIQWKLETDSEWNNVIAVDDLKGADGATPEIGSNGNWFINGEDTGKQSTGDKGEKGATFTPHVDLFGKLSWTNDGDLPNPETVNIMGKQGMTGPYFTPSVDGAGNLSWTNNGYLENPDIVNIKGEQGYSMIMAQPAEAVQMTVEEFDAISAGDHRYIAWEADTYWDEIYWKINHDFIVIPVTLTNIKNTAAFIVGEVDSTDGSKPSVGYDVVATVRSGIDGIDGDDGDDGVGVPAGGTTGQVLKKKSNTDYDTEWSDEEGGVGVPAGGTTGQVLKKKSNTDYDTEWSDEEGGGAATEVTKSAIANALGCTEAQLDTLVALAQKVTVSGSDVKFATGTVLKSSYFDAVD